MSSSHFVKIELQKLRKQLRRKRYACHKFSPEIYMTTSDILSSKCAGLHTIANINEFPTNSSMNDTRVNAAMLPFEYRRGSINIDGQSGQLARSYVDPGQLTPNDDSYSANGGNDSNVDNDIRVTNAELMSTIAKQNNEIQMYISLANFFSHQIKSVGVSLALVEEENRILTFEIQRYRIKQQRLQWELRQLQSRIKELEGKCKDKKEERAEKADSEDNEKQEKVLDVGRMDEETEKKAINDNAVENEDVEEGPASFSAN